MGRRLSVLPLLALIAMLALPCAAQATITGTVYMDYNSNGANNVGGFASGSSVTATDIGVGSVTINAYDATGTRVSTATSSANGSYTVCSSGCSGTVRLEFSVPSGYQPSFKGANNGTSVRFVNATATGVDFAVTQPVQYCQDNPQLVTCMFPYLSNPSPGAITLASAMTNTLSMDERGRVLSPTPSLIGGTPLNSSGALGATFGVGVDRGRNAYFGTYVKRHSPYGIGGATNAIYRVNQDTGDTSVFATLGINTLPAHVATAPAGWPAYSADGYRSDNNASDVFHLVGRAGIGDVDVTPDGTTLYAVEMTQASPKLWSVPINGTGASTTAGTPVAYSIAPPATFGGVPCLGNWHPMGIGMSPSTILVGGVCGDEPSAATYSITNSAGTGSFNGQDRSFTITTATAHGLRAGDLVQIDLRRGDWCESGGALNLWTASAAYIITAVPSTTSFTVQLSSGNASFCGAQASTGTVSIFAERHPSAFIMQFDPAAHTFTTIAAVDLGYMKALSNSNLASSGLANGSVGSGDQSNLGLWHAWNEFDPRPAELSVGAYPEPMLANIETRADGSLILGFRDRWMDQTTPNAIDYDTANPASPSPSNVYNGGADTLLLCKSGSTYAMESNGTCGSTVGGNQPDLLTSDADPNARAGSPLFYWNGFADASYIRHPYTSEGGLTMMPGNPTLWSTAYDINNAWQQGVRALGACPSRTGAGSCGPAGAAEGATIAGTVFDFTSAWSLPSSGKPPGGCGGDCWGKGNGLGDLEVLCDAAPVQIGNLVWIDTNKNGVQDPGEPAAAGVTVHLYDATNTLVGTAITDANGTYYFSSTVTEAAAGDGDNAGGGVVAGAAFTVRLDNPADYAGAGPLAPYVLTSATQTSAGTGSQSTSVDSNATLVAGYPQVSIPARTAGQNNHTFDIGFTTPIVVGMGDKTWVDANGNGVQDAGEPALAGVVVQLLNPDGTPATDAQGNVVASVTTDANGAYFIGNLRPGSYKAQFTLPSGYVFTSTGAGTSATDSNPTPGANPLIGTTGTFTIAGSATGDTTAVSGNPTADFANLTIDAGVKPLVGMGDKTWVDANGNGVQDVGEPALAGVVVQLLNPNGTPATDAQGNAVASVTTDVNGAYFIGNLLPGSYKAQFTLPSGYVFTSTGAGTSATDSNPTPGANPLIGTTGTFTIAATATGDTTASTAATARFANLTIDAGVKPLVGMGDYTWIDANANGIQDAGEAPLAGVIVQLMNAAGTAVATDAQGNPVPSVTTDATGHYFIGNLLAGSYSAKFTLPSGYAFTSSGAGTSATDSNPSTAVNANTKLTPSFTIAGSATGDTTAVTQPNAQYANLTVDAGVIPLVGMGNYTWIDANINGIQDPGELPLAGVVVKLLNAAGTAPATDASGTPVASVTTDATGFYFIGNLLPGTYKAEFDLPTGYRFTSTGGGTTATDSNPVPTAQALVGITPAFTIAGSATGDTTAVTQPTAQFANLTIDAGVITSSSPYTGGPVGMGDYVWIDTNGNGIQDGGELPLQGVIVTLLTPAGAPAVDYLGNPVPAATTDATGHYFIGNLDAGTYKAQFTLPGGYIFTSTGAGTSSTDSNPTPGANPLIGTTGTFTIAGSATGDTTAVSGNPTANFANLTIDAGVKPVVGMGDYTWIDANGNGQQDVGETPLSGVIVQLLNSAGSGPATDAQGVVVSPVTTDATGHYFVGNLLPGTYKAQFTLPSGYIFTTPTTGAGATDSNPTPVTGAPQIGVTPAFTIAASATGDTTVSTQPNASFANLTIDAGVVPVVGMGDYTWIDDNQNGIQDAGEAPLPGVMVELLKADGTAAVDAQGAPVASVITDANGAYFIGNLLPGSYKARFTIPSGYTFTTAAAGTSANDSNPSPGANPLVGTTATFTIAGSASGDTTAVSGKWRASFANLTIDAGVVPVPSQNGGGGSGGGSGGSGGGGSSASSDSTAPSTKPSTPTKGRGTSGPLNGPGKNGANSNGVNGGPGSSNPVPGANRGALVGVGDLVWFDMNGNGIQDAGEQPMRGATVVILNPNGKRARNANGKVIPAQTTDANGHYFFSNMQPGRYQVKFIYPKSYIATVPGKGAQSKGSNAKATSKRNVAITPTFVVAGVTYGETTKVKGIRKASFVNPSIDAGVVPPWAQRVAGPESVTG